ncbi:MAG: glucose 1-dehydrogenase [Cytophagales bacterium]|nr:glucose 1-dehydrogenase [Cytophagales bacterium]MDW8383164.1 glucose 1-dehydrogenase [Flammeovirgaceae bacterium]
MVHHPTRFLNKIVVITGGAKGIGEATARYFSANGSQIAILDIDENKGKELANELNIKYYFCDVSKENQVKNTFSKVQSDLGNVDILINNAGIQRYSTVTETTEEEWDLVMNVNLKSAFLCAKYAIPHMLRKQKGVIINVASVQSFMSQARVAPYTTSKTALLGLTRSIAVDYAPQVRCVAVCPGTVNTPMLQHDVAQVPNPEEALQACRDMALSKRIAEPEEIANLIGFLCSPEADFITGHAIRIDGGLGVMIPSEV